MASAVRAHATDRGVDWRGVPLLAFGGAGPVHACHVAELLDSSTVIYPPLASVLSAFGTLVTPLRLDLVRSDLGLLRQLDWARVDAKLTEMREEARAALLNAGCRHDEARITLGADLRYFGQQNELTISLSADAIRKRDVKAIARRVRGRAYKRTYGVRLDGRRCRGGELARHRPRRRGSARQAIRMPVSANGEREAPPRAVQQPASEIRRSTHARRSAPGQTIKRPRRSSRNARQRS